MLSRKKLRKRKQMWFQSETAGTNYRRGLIAFIWEWSLFNRYRYTVASFVVLWKPPITCHWKNAVLTSRTVSYLQDKVMANLSFSLFFYFLYSKFSNANDDTSGQLLRYPAKQLYYRLYLTQLINWSSEEYIVSWA